MQSSTHIDLGENAFGEDVVPHSEPIEYNENNTFYYGIVTEGRRRLDIDFSALSAPLFKYKLDPLESAKIFIDLSKIPKQMMYNVHYQISILDEE